MFNWTDYRINQMQREATLREVEMSRMAKEVRNHENRRSITGRLVMSLSNLLATVR